MIYRVLLGVENVVTFFEGQFRRVGFYTTRYVEAPTLEDAPAVAFKELSGEAKYRQMVLNEMVDPPVFKVEEIHEVSAKGSNPGYTLYRIDH